MGRCAVSVPPVPGRGGDGSGGVLPDPGVPNRLGLYAGVRAGGRVSRSSGAIYVEPPAQGSRRCAGNPDPRHRRRQYRRCPRHQWIRRRGWLVVIITPACFEFHRLFDLFVGMSRWL